MEQLQKRESGRALLIGVSCRRGAVYNSSEETLRELSGLVETAGGEAVCSLWQQRDTPDSATYIGEGKAAEARELCAAQELDLVVFDGELSPSQLSNLEREIDCRVIDRSMLILDIFALHAVTSEGKLQVELAQMKYTLPRLAGKGLALSRLGGGIGTRGPGESKLETDRRHIRARIAAVRRELDEVKKNRGEKRALRDRSGVPRVAIVGYTNAGKSTLLNYLTGAGVLSEDKLFATLDPTTRRLRLPQGMEIYLTDTVGLIRNLPHQFIEAFSSTLDELKYADLLLQVVDVSNPDCAAHIEVVEKLASELGAGAIPMVIALNKCDREGELPVHLPEAVPISARTGQGIPALLTALERELAKRMHACTVVLPFSEGQLLDRLHRGAQIEREEYLPEGIRLTLTVDDALYNRISRYLQ